MNDQPSRPRFRRPAILDPASLDEFGVGHLDPALISQIAHDTAAAIVGTGRFRADPELTERLVAITDDIGLDTVARLWADRPARSLPGALWRLYVLREWVRRDPAGASTDYRGGQVYADVAAVVAGAAGAPGPQELQELTDAIVRGIYQGDVAVALDRAAAFCRVVAAGRAARDDAGVLAKDDAIVAVLDTKEPEKGLIAHTVKGKGVSFMEDDNNWHYRAPTADEVARARRELDLA